MAVMKFFTFDFLGSFTEGIINVLNLPSKSQSLDISWETNL